MTEHLTVGRHDTQHDALDLIEWRMEWERGMCNPVPHARFTLRHTGDARRIRAGDAVRFAIGSPMAETLFCGMVEARCPMPAHGTVDVLCRGTLWPTVEGDVYRATIRAGTLHGYLSRWAEMYAPPSIGEVSIAVTEPAILPPSISIGVGRQVDFLRELRKYCAVAVRVYRPEHATWDAVPPLVLEFRDEVLPGPVDGARVQRLKQPVSLPEKLYRPSPVVAVVAAGEVVATWPETGTPNTFQRADWLANDPERAQAYARLCHDAVRHRRRSGLVTIERGLHYADPNDCIGLVLEDRQAINCAIQNLTLTRAMMPETRRGPTMRDIRTTVSVTDVVHPVYVPGAMLGGPNASAHPAGPGAGKMAERLREAYNPAHASDATTGPAPWLV